VIAAAERLHDERCPSARVRGFEATAHDIVPVRLGIVVLAVGGGIPEEFFLNGGGQAVLDAFHNLGGRKEALPQRYEVLGDGGLEV
jgi:hypothetical protein